MRLYWVTLLGSSLRPLQPGLPRPDAASKVFRVGRDRRVAGWFDDVVQVLWDCTLWRGNLNQPSVPPHTATDKPDIPAGGQARHIRQRTTLRCCARGVARPQRRAWPVGKRSLSRANDFNAIRRRTTPLADPARDGSPPGSGQTGCCHRVRFGFGGNVPILRPPASSWMWPPLPSGCQIMVSPSDGTTSSGIS